MPNLVAVTGGKGGVGKTSIACGIACELAAEGVRVLLVDGDIGLGDADIVLGVAPKHDMADAVSGGMGLGEIVEEVRPGLFLLAGGSGVEELADLAPGRRAALLEELAGLCKSYDLVVADTSPGAGSNVRELVRMSSLALLVATPEPASVQDAYALGKLARGEGWRGGLLLVVNRAQTEDQARMVSRRLRSVFARFVGEMADYGWVPEDGIFRSAVVAGRAPRDAAPHSPARLAVRGIALRLMGDMAVLTVAERGS